MTLTFNSLCVGCPFILNVQRLPYIAFRQYWKRLEDNGCSRTAVATASFDRAIAVSYIPYSSIVSEFVYRTVTWIIDWQILAKLFFGVVGDVGDPRLCPTRKNVSCPSISVTLHAYLSNLVQVGQRVAKILTASFY